MSRSRSPKPSARSRPEISTARAPRPSRRAACSRMTQRCTCCWDACIWRKDAAQQPPKSCAGRCGSIRSLRPRTVTWGSRSCRSDDSLKPSRVGINGSGSPAAVPMRRRSAAPCSVPATPRECSAMAEDIRALSAQLAQDPQSLVFLRLGEALRRKGQLDGAVRVAVNGLERHPHLADAHDLYARVLTDKHDYERAFDEWDMAVRIAPNHTGALKGLAFLYFKVGDLAQAEAHLELARKVEPDDPSIDQAIAMMRGGVSPPAPTAPTAEHAPAPTAMPAATDRKVFAGLEGANEGLL